MESQSAQSWDLMSSQASHCDLRASLRIARVEGRGLGSHHICLLIACVLAGGVTCDSMEFCGVAKCAKLGSYEFPSVALPSQGVPKDRKGGGEGSGLAPHMLSN